MFLSYGNWQSGLHDLVNEMKQGQWRADRTAKADKLRKQGFEDADQRMQQKLHDSQLRTAGQQQDLLGIKVQDERNARTEPMGLDETMAQIAALRDGVAPAAGPSVAAGLGIGAGVLAPGSVNADAKYARAIPQGWQPDAGAPDPSAAGPGVDVAQVAASLASGGVQTGSSAGPINSDQNWQSRGGGSVPPAGFVPRGAGARAGTPMGWTVSMAPRLRAPDAVAAVQGEMGTTRLPPPVSGVRDVAAEVSGVMTSPTGQMSSGRRSTQLDQATEAFARMPDATRFYLTGKHSPLDAAQGWVEQQQGAALGQRKAEAPLPIDPRTEMSAADTATHKREDAKLALETALQNDKLAGVKADREHRAELAKQGIYLDTSGKPMMLGAENADKVRADKMKMWAEIKVPEKNPATKADWGPDEADAWKDKAFEKQWARFGAGASGLEGPSSQGGAGAGAKPAVEGTKPTAAQKASLAQGVSDQVMSGKGQVDLGGGRILEFTPTQLRAFEQEHGALSGDNVDVLRDVMLKQTRTAAGIAQRNDPTMPTNTIKQFVKEKMFGLPNQNPLPSLKESGPYRRYAGWEAMQPFEVRQMLRSKAGQAAQAELVKHPDYTRMLRAKAEGKSTDNGVLMNALLSDLKKKLPEEQYNIAKMLVDADQQGQTIPGR